MSEEQMGLLKGVSVARIAPRITHLIFANDLWTRFSYKPVCNPFAITHYVAAYKTIYMYYLKKSHDLLNRSCD